MVHITKRHSAVIYNAEKGRIEIMSFNLVFFSQRKKPPGLGTPPKWVIKALALERDSGGALYMEMCQRAVVWMYRNPNARPRFCRAANKSGYPIRDGQGAPIVPANDDAKQLLAAIRCASDFHSKHLPVIVELTGNLLEFGWARFAREILTNRMNFIRFFNEEFFLREKMGHNPARTLNVLRPWRHKWMSADAILRQHASQRPISHSRLPYTHSAPR